ncbi:MAG: hypothetical protein FWH05_09370, partial [Oscillospiraceae bacterium]|nr:hypothetical protein [Oscillospiraceae bacterium]
PKPHHQQKSPSTTHINSLPSLANTHIIPYQNRKVKLFFDKIIKIFAKSETPLSPPHPHPFPQDIPQKTPPPDKNCRAV